MINTNITNFRKEIFGLLEQTIKYNEPINVNTKDGNAVIISEEDYNGLMETLYLSSIPGMKEKIVEGLKTPLEDCIPEDQVEWWCTLLFILKKRVEVANQVVIIHVSLPVKAIALRVVKMVADSQLREDSFK